MKSRLPVQYVIIILKEQESNKFLPKYLEVTNIFLIFAAWKKKNIRQVIYSEEFNDFYDSLDSRIQDKFDYGLRLIKTQYVVNKKFVKHLENTNFYELRISVSSDEYRTVLFAIDNDSFIQSKRVILLNSFIKKGTKQYKTEIKMAERLLKKYLED